MGTAGFLLPVVGVGQQSLLAVGIAEVELEGIVGGAAALEEDGPVAKADETADARGGGVVEFGDAGLELRVAGQAFERGMGTVGMDLHPGGDGRVLLVFKRAVGVVDDGAEEGVLHLGRRKYRQRLRQGSLAKKGGGSAEPRRSSHGL